MSIQFLPLILAILSPIIWAAMNIADKYVVSHRTKNPLSFAAVAGLVNLIIGLIIVLFLDWSMLNLNNFIFPALAGVFLGSQFFFYYIILSKEDASDMIGFVYLYPIIVAVLSYLFLHEVISLLGYIGMFITLLGVILLSIKKNTLKLKVSIWMFFSLVFITALYEFFIKVATNNLPEINGIAINIVFIGLSVLCILFHKKTRKGFRFELRNFKWAILSESLTFLGILTTYFAMAAMPATVFSSIAATQPLFVLMFERIIDKKVGKMIKHHLLLPKLIPILLITLGVILLYSQEIINILR